MSLSMLSYIREVKKGFREQHGFEPSRIVSGEPCFDSIPDGIYPMIIDGKKDYVTVSNGGISCCNWTKPKHFNENH